MNALPNVIYLDYQATTPMDPRVCAQMQTYFTTDFGNASSSQHAFGWSAQKAVTTARAQVAKLIGAQPREIYFTSGATESINWVFHSLIELSRTEPVHILTSQVEHAATLGATLRAQRWGVEVDYIPVDSTGKINLSTLESLLKPHTKLVSVIHGNNEIGTLQDLKQISLITKTRGIWLHADAAQSAGKIPLAVHELGVDLLSLSAHKMYGPKGVGALFIRSQNPRVQLKALHVGGGQERGLRAGTLNVPGIVGFGTACAIAQEELTAESSRLELLRNELEAQLKSLGGVRINGSADRLPGNLSVTLEGVTASQLFPHLGQLAVSTGSACGSEDAQPSHVLLAIGLSEQQARSTFRISLGRPTTADEIKRTFEVFSGALGKLKTGPA